MLVRESTKPIQRLTPIAMTFLSGMDVLKPNCSITGANIEKNNGYSLYTEHAQRLGERVCLSLVPEIAHENLQHICWLVHFTRALFLRGLPPSLPFSRTAAALAGLVTLPPLVPILESQDRKSTRLNSSHQIIS